jgi:hypothetical protein
LQLSFQAAKTIKETRFKSLGRQCLAKAILARMSNGALAFAFKQLQMNAHQKLAIIIAYVPGFPQHSEQPITVRGVTLYFKC